MAAILSSVFLIALLLAVVMILLLVRAAVVRAICRRRGHRWQVGNGGWICRRCGEETAWGGEPW